MGSSTTISDEGRRAPFILGAQHHSPRRLPVLKLGKQKNKRGNPDPEAEVVALSPRTLTTTNRYECEACGQGFPREQNLQLHRRGHNLPWMLGRNGGGGGGGVGGKKKKKVYVCPVESCVHHQPSRALGDITGVKKHYLRKHGEKRWTCRRCSKRYAVLGDWKAHVRVCGTKEYTCRCGTIFARKDTFSSHQILCDSMKEGSEDSTAAAGAAAGAQEDEADATSPGADQAPPLLQHQPPPVLQLMPFPWVHSPNPNPNPLPIPFQPMVVTPLSFLPPPNHFVSYRPPTAAQLSPTIAPAAAAAAAQNFPRIATVAQRRPASIAHVVPSGTIAPSDVGRRYLSSTAVLQRAAATCPLLRNGSGVSCTTATSAAEISRFGAAAVLPKEQSGDNYTQTRDFLRTSMASPAPAASCDFCGHATASSAINHAPKPEPEEWPPLPSTAAVPPWWGQRGNE